MLSGEKRIAKAVGVPAYDFAWLLTSFTKEGNPVIVPQEAKEKKIETAEPAVVKTAVPKAAVKKSAAKKPAAKKATVKKTARGKKGLSLYDN